MENQIKELFHSFIICSSSFLYASHDRLRTYRFETFCLFICLCLTVINIEICGSARNSTLFYLRGRRDIVFNLIYLCLFVWMDEKKNIYNFLFKSACNMFLLRKSEALKNCG